MPRTFPLRAVLSLREQKEQVEERALVALTAEVRRAEASLAQLERELAQTSASRVKEVQQVHSAAHHQAIAARWRQLRAAQAEMRAQLLTLQNRRLEQQNRFISARRERETLTELQEHHARTLLIESNERERKQIEDLFAARWRQR